MKSIKIIGVLLLSFGLVDLACTYADLDLWADFIGVKLPDVLWQYSAFIEIGLGYFIFKLETNKITKNKK